MPLDVVPPIAGVLGGALLGVTLLLVLLFRNRKNKLLWLASAGSMASMVVSAAAGTWDALLDTAQSLLMGPLWQVTAGVLAISVVASVGAAIYYGPPQEVQKQTAIAYMLRVVALTLMAAGSANHAQSRIVFTACMASLPLLHKLLLVAKHSWIGRCCGRMGWWVYRPIWLRLRPVRQFRTPEEDEMLVEQTTLQEMAKLRQQLALNYARVQGGAADTAIRRFALHHGPDFDAPASWYASQAYEVEVDEDTGEAYWPDDFDTDEAMMEAMRQEEFQAIAEEQARQTRAHASLSFVSPRQRKLLSSMSREATRSRGPSARAPRTHTGGRGHVVPAPTHATPTRLHF